jgi:tetratricopeptide (TPR) repeat protein
LSIEGSELSVERSPPRGAVFLSYASQDAEAARRIAEALRAAGIEVWFDQSELRGGDAWDANIRRQIKDCALFVPVISQHTQERDEGYFRREWKLGVERTHDMAEDVAFIVPLVVDDTSDASARVPDKFREVQWTRLPGGEMPAAFVERVKVLLAGGDVARASRLVGAEIMGREPHATPKPRRASGWPWLAAAAVVIGVTAALALWQPWRKPENPASGLTPPVAEARQLVQQARTLLWGPNVSRADLETGEQLFEKAKALDPTDAEVWAIGALTDMRYFVCYFDRSDAREGQARTKAARALKLAPDSLEARLVQVCVLSSVVADSSIRPEAERLIKSLLDEKPGDLRVLGAKGGLLTVEGRDDEAAVYYRRANDPISEGWAYYHLGRMADAEAAADRAIASGHSVAGLLLKAHVKVYGREDLEAAQAAIDQLPASELLEEEPATRAAGIRFFRGEPDKVLEILRAVPRDWIWYNGSEVPKAMFNGFAHHLANHPAAAQADWRAALRFIDERLATQSNNPPLIGRKAHLLALLGERDDAERDLRLYQHLQGQRDGQITVETAGIYVLLGRREEIIDVLAAALKDPKAGLFLHADLRFNPVWDPLRGDPRFEALLRETLPKGAKPFDDQKPAPSPAPEGKK